MQWSHVKSVDPEVYGAIVDELGRQRKTLELIASENFTSQAVIEAMGTPLTNKYAEGYPGKRYYGGCRYVDVVEDLALDRVKELFSAEAANVQPHSGAQANMAAYQAVLSPGDTVMGLSLAEGGHLTHGSRVNFSGKLYKIVPYGLDPKTEQIDMDAVRQLAREHHPKMIVAGASAYPRTIDFAAFRKIADEVGAYLMVDMAHIAGLVAAGLHPSPVGVADLVTSTTHKTLRGPRGGFVLPTADLAPKVDKAVFPGIQGGPLMHVIAAKAVCFKEALSEGFRTYQRQVAENAKVLATCLASAGYHVVSGGTDTHLMLISFVGTDITGKDAEETLERIGITVNKNAVPGDPLPPRVTSGIRLGTPAITSRGMGREEMMTVGRIIVEALKERQDQGHLERLAGEVQALAEAHPLYKDLSL